MPANKISEALRGSVMFHGASMLPRLRQMTPQDRQNLMRELGEVSGELPLQFGSELNPSELARLSFPTWSSEPISPAKTTALMVFLLWVSVGENPDMCASLYDTWPIAEAVILAS